MIETAIRKPWNGIFPPLITPLLDSGETDPTGLERLVERVVQAGVSGIFALGTSAEFPGMTLSQRRRALQILMESVDRRVPVVVNISGTAFPECVAQAEHAGQAGADAVALLPPFYYPVSQDELIAFVEAFLDQSPLPVVLYNFPAMAKVTFGIPAVRQLASHRNVIGLKDSSGDTEYFRELLNLTRERPDWTFWTGPEKLLAWALKEGAHGGISGGANVCPELFVALHAACRAGDFQKADNLQSAVDTLGTILFTSGEPPGSVIRGMKAGARWMGDCSSRTLPPLRPMTEEEYVKLSRQLQEFWPRLQDLLAGA